MRGSINRVDTVLGALLGRIPAALVTAVATTAATTTAAVFAVSQRLVAQRLVAQRGISYLLSHGLLRRLVAKTATAGCSCLIVRPLFSFGGSAGATCRPIIATLTGAVGRPFADSLIATARRPASAFAGRFRRGYLGPFKGWIARLRRIRIQAAAGAGTVASTPRTLLARRPVPAAAAPFRPIPALATLR
ncbi:MAG: hypothetical protein H0T52_03425, partial [Lautropia sp.]|nr:hypothetical protein [Lautropia sp.]